MNEKDFLNLILQLWQKMTGAVGTGAQWEIWLQVEMCAALLKDYGTAGREFKYDGRTETVDIQFQLDGKVYQIELKVESAQTVGTFGGKSVMKAHEEDVYKLEKYGAPDARKWYVCVAYSVGGKKSLQDMHAKGLFNYIDKEASFVAALKVVL